MIAVHIPGPHVIEEECHEIQRAWTDAECRRRAANALRRQAELWSLLAEIDRLAEQNERATVEPAPRTEASVAP